MKQQETNKRYPEFTFEEFLQDDFFVSSMIKPASATSAFWERFRETNSNYKHFEAAKAYIESINSSHYSLSKTEIDHLRRSIHKKANRKKRNRMVLYRYAGAAAVACIAVMAFLRFYNIEKQDVISMKPDITTFAEMSRSDAKANDIQLILSDEQALLFDKKEAVITYDTTGILVDEEMIVQSESAEFNQLVVPLGKRSKLNLSDGSIVWINSGSRIIYPAVFESDRREIYVDGEVYIEVKEELHRPFVVHTKVLDMQVLGTSFNISSYESESEKVVLVTGSIQIVSKGDEQITLLLPEQMFWLENGRSHIEMVDTRKYTSWIEGVYYCDNESLGSIFQRLSRYYGIEIRCDSSISGVVYSGKLDLKENLSDIFEGISFTLPLSYSEENGEYVILQIE